MTMRDIRSRIKRKLLFRFDPERELIEVKLPDGHIETVHLDDYRPMHRRRLPSHARLTGVNFERIDGDDP